MQIAFGESIACCRNERDANHCDPTATWIIDNSYRHSLENFHLISSGTKWSLKGLSCTLIIDGDLMRWFQLQAEQLPDSRIVTIVRNAPVPVFAVSAD